VAVRLEPIILELEREQNDLLIIAHESVLRVLYGYLMACNSTDIPFLSFPRNEILEVGHRECPTPLTLSNGILRSSRRATTMKPSVSRFLTCLLRSFPLHQKISRSRSHLVVLLLQWQADLEALKMELRRRRPGQEPRPLRTTTSLRSESMMLSDSANVPCSGGVRRF
jgi:hypothetical protein